MGISIPSMAVMVSIVPIGSIVAIAAVIAVAPVTSTTSTLSLGLALLGGLLTVLSPCVLPILPIIVGRSLQSHVTGPIALVAGLVSGFAIAGSLLGITASWLAGVAQLLRTGALVLLLGFGGLALFPTWSYRLARLLPLSRGPLSQGHPSNRLLGLMVEFWLGTQLGLLWTPCAGPVLGGILVLAAVEHQALGAFWLLLVYGVGAAIPLLAIAYGGRRFSQRLLRLRSQSATLQRLGGLMIISTAIAILLGWDVQIQLWLAPFFPALPL